MIIGIIGLAKNINRVLRKKNMRIGDTFVGFIGFGHMIQAIYGALFHAKVISPSHVAFVQRDAHKMKEHQKTFKITGTSLKNLVEKSEVLVIGVRPAQLPSLLESLSTLDLQEKKILTIVAGVPFQVYQEFLGSSVPIIRAMPNIASSVREGMTVLSFGEGVPIEFQSFARIFFATLGSIEEVEERFMDIACAIAGSGPGFVFQLIYAMAKEGESEGLALEPALKMASQAFLGAAKLILQGKRPEDLITQIATPGGTTEAGFFVMQETKMAELFRKVIRAAADKSKSFH